MSSAPKPVSLLPGCTAAVAIAIVALVTGLVAPVPGSAAIALLIGLIIRMLMGTSDVLAPGIAFASKRLLQAAIIMLGAGLNLDAVWRVGSSSLLVMVGTLAIGLASILALGRVSRVQSTAVQLIGVGTAICGASAIAAVAPVIEADQVSIALSVSTIFLYNIAGIVFFPLVGHSLHLTQHGFGVWAGTAINDTSSVVAASTVYGKASTSFAVIVKLTRTIMIVPVVLLFAMSRGDRSSSLPRRLRTSFPVFIVWFVAASVLHTVGLLGFVSISAQQVTSQFFIAVALAGVGLSTDIRTLRKAGLRPLIIGGAGWLIVAISSLLLQAMIGLR